MDATQEGAILDRLENYLTAQESPVEEPKQTEQVEEVEEVPAETEVEAEQEQKDDVPSEVEESQLELSQFAKILGIDEDKLDLDDEGNVYVKTKIDGEEGRAKFHDLVKSYQLEGHLNKQNMEVAEQRKALQAKMAEVEQQAQARVQQLEAVTNVAIQELHREFQSIDWQTLRATDPGEYAAKLTEFQQREARIGQAVQQIQAEKYQAETQNQERFKEYLREESQKLLNAIPEWSNPEIAQKEKTELKSFAVQHGFTAQELDQLSDHRSVLILRMAKAYADLQKSKPDVTKKVVKAPKLVKPGSPVSKQERDQNSVAALKSAIKKSGGDKGIEAYLLRTGKV